ncbi:hypothetical protein ACQP1G_17515 [Nocardia sp. CA-107356]|uniref:hypothetical protein n=1 Tax=Nocardia sp. CA-107356 TaxID=3239972 RepID=UPI003D8C37FF
MRLSDISATEIEQMTMAERGRLMQYVQVKVRQEIPDCRPPFAAIESTLEFFDLRGWGQPGTWISVVDSHVLAAVVHSVCAMSDATGDTSGNPAVLAWTEYLNRLRTDPHWQHTNRDDHDSAWAHAEHVATEYGRGQAEALGIKHDEVQFRWYLLSSMYRSWMVEPPRLSGRFLLCEGCGPCPSVIRSSSVSVR